MQSTHKKKGASRKSTYEQSAFRKKKKSTYKIKKFPKQPPLNVKSLQTRETNQSWFIGMIDVSKKVSVGGGFLLKRLAKQQLRWRRRRRCRSGRIRIHLRKRLELGDGMRKKGSGSGFRRKIGKNVGGGKQRGFQKSQLNHLLFIILFFFTKMFIDQIEISKRDVLNYCYYNLFMVSSEDFVAGLYACHGAHYHLAVGGLHFGQSFSVFGMA